MSQLHREHPEKSDEEVAELGRHHVALAEGAVWCPTCKAAFKIEPPEGSPAIGNPTEWAALVKRICQSRACPHCGDHNLEVDTRRRR